MSPPRSRAPLGKPAPGRLQVMLPRAPPLTLQTAAPARGLVGGHGWACLSSSLNSLGNRVPFKSRPSLKGKKPWNWRVLGHTCLAGPLAWQRHVFNLLGTSKTFWREVKTPAGLAAHHVECPLPIPPPFPLAHRNGLGSFLSLSCGYFWAFPVFTKQEIAGQLRL